MTIAGRNLRKVFGPGFLIAVAILAIAAVGLNGATALLQLHFQKLPVYPARSLTEIGAKEQKLGPWEQVSKDEPLTPDTEMTLGTTMYVFRDYVDRRLVKRDELDKFKDQTFNKRKELLAQIQSRNPSAVITMAVTYYTGKADTVAHIPERCYTADGYEYRPGEKEDVTWRVISRDLRVRFINFEDQTGRSNLTKSVGYFFQCNGIYTCESIEVRRILQNLWEKYGYYAKVELLTLIKNRTESARVMTDFLNSSLPEIEKCFPDWESVKRGGTGQPTTAPAEAPRTANANKVGG